MSGEDRMNVRERNGGLGGRDENRERQDKEE